MHAQIAEVAHQEKRGKMREQKTKAGQPASNAPIFFHLLMAGVTKRYQIVGLIRLVG
jgi:hypothetical protein